MAMYLCQRNGPAVPCERNCELPHLPRCARIIAQPVYSNGDSSWYHLSQPAKAVIRLKRHRICVETVEKTYESGKRWQRRRQLCSTGVGVA